jgi:hypothetical protein
MPILERLMIRFMDKIDRHTGHPLHPSIIFQNCLAYLCPDTFLDFDSELVLLTFDFIGESAFGIEFDALEDSQGDSGRFLKLMRESVDEMIWFIAFPPFKYVRHQNSSHDSVFIEFCAFILRSCVGNTTKFKQRFRKFVVCAQSS